MKNTRVIRLGIVVFWIVAYFLIRYIPNVDAIDVMPIVMKIVFPAFFMLSVYELYLFNQIKKEFDSDNARVTLDGLFAIKLDEKLEVILRYLSPILFFIISVFVWYI